MYLRERNILVSTDLKINIQGLNCDNVICLVNSHEDHIGVLVHCQVNECGILLVTLTSL